MAASREEQVFFSRAIQFAMRQMVKAPVVRMHEGRFFGAEVIVPMTGAAE
jgi:hypothetical protein